MAVERIRIRRDAAATWTSENPTLGLGEMGIETDTGRVKVGDGATAWITLDYAYAKADRVVSKSADYTITGAGDDNIVNVTTAATDRTITLPAGSGMAAGDTIEVHKVDSGTGKVIVARASTDTIDGVTGIDIDSQYDYAEVEWTGAYWTVTQYKDHGYDATYSGDWERDANGRMSYRFTKSVTSTWTVHTFPVPFVDADYRVTGNKHNGNQAVTYRNKTATTVELYEPSSGQYDIVIIGRWRA